MAKNLQLKPKKGKNDLYGFVNGRQEWVISPLFDMAWDFSNGIAMIKQKDKYGFIKIDGDYLYEPQFSDACSFYNGVSSVALNGKWGLINADGNYLFEPQFTTINKFEDGIAEVEQDDKYGFIKNDGTFIAKPQFDEVKEFLNGYALVKLNNTWLELGTDGTLNELSKAKSYSIACDEMQNEDCPGWSFIEASVKNGKYKFKSWGRIMEDNYEDDEPEICYYDEVVENKAFAKWANSMNLSTYEEVGELLWANAQQLINYAKVIQSDGGHNSPMRDLTILIQLYWQLKNIEELGLQDVRKDLDLPIEDNLYLNSYTVKEKAEKFCTQLSNDYDYYEYLDFYDLTEKSHKPGEYNCISEYEEDDEEEWDEDEDE